MDTGTRLEPVCTLQRPIDSGPERQLPTAVKLNSSFVAAVTQLRSVSGHDTEQVAWAKRV